MRLKMSKNILFCYQFTTNLAQSLHRAQRFYLIDKRELILPYIAVPERKFSLKWREKLPLLSLIHI